MKIMKRSKTILAVVATAGILVGQVPAVAANGIQQAPQGQTSMRDVVLGEGGVLTGQVMNQQGAPAAGAIVVLQDSHGRAMQVAADQNGVFKAPGMSTGIYHVTSQGRTTVLRAWTQQIAPPAATSGVMVVGQDGATVRGQGPYGGIFAAGGVAVGFGTWILLKDEDQS